MANKCFDCLYCIGGNCLLNGEEISLPREKEACKCFDSDNIYSVIALYIADNYNEYISADDIFDILVHTRTFEDISEEEILLRFIENNLSEIKEKVEVDYLSENGLTYY